MSKKELLIQSGEVLYGDQWKTDLARSLGIKDSRRIRQWITDGEFPDGVLNDLEFLLINRMSDIKKTLSFIAAEKKIANKANLQDCLSEAEDELKELTFRINTLCQTLICNEDKISTINALISNIKSGKTKGTQSLSELKSLKAKIINENSEIESQKYLIETQVYIKNTEIFYLKQQGNLDDDSI